MALRVPWTGSHHEADRILLILLCPMHSFTGANA